MKEEITENCTETLLALKDSIELWGSKWKLLILLYLFHHRKQKNSFNAIKESLLGISAKMLTKELRELEQNDLVMRTVCNTRPITVDYTITRYGEGVLPIADLLTGWGLQHRKKIKATL